MGDRLRLQGGASLLKADPLWALRCGEGVGSGWTSKSRFSVEGNIPSSGGGQLRFVSAIRIPGPAGDTPFSACAIWTGPLRGQLSCTCQKLPAFFLLGPCLIPSFGARHYPQISDSSLNPGGVLTGHGLRHFFGLLLGKGPQAPVPWSVLSGSAACQEGSGVTAGSRGGGTLALLVRGAGIDG